MVHNWNTILILPKVVDNISGKEMFMEAEVNNVTYVNESINT